MTLHQDPAIDDALYSAFRSHPYYARSLSALRIVADPAVATMATSKEWVTHYNPATVAGWTVDETAAVLVHELEHLLRDHAGRACDREHGRWNRAADAEINERLPGLPDGAIYPETLGTSRGRTAETYYAVAGDDGGEGQSGQPGQPGEPGQSGSGQSGDGQPGQPGDCGSAADGQPRDYERGDAQTPGPGRKHDNGASARRDAARDVLNNGSGIGTVDGDERRAWAESELGIDRSAWLTALASTVAQSVAAYGVPNRWAWPGRRDMRDMGGAMVPRWTGSRPRVAVVIDTSGSISPADLDLARTAATFLMRAADVTFYACGTRAHPLGTALPEHLSGGGATDMGEGVRHAAADGHKVIIVVTDCETRWGVDPGVPVIIAANVGAASILSSRSYPIPRWATVVPLLAGYR